MPNLPKEQQDALLQELTLAGIKHSPEKILRITKLTNGKIVFLETGDTRSGLQHILKNHQNQFQEKGISATEIPDLIIVALTHGTIVAYQSGNRPIYEVEFNGIIQAIAITVGENGYIVCANPRST